MNQFLHKCYIHKKLINNSIQPKLCHPFGMQMQYRSYVNNGKDYRYGFNGQEKDNEVKGQGNSMTAAFWQYDNRLGRRWNIDPMTAKWISTYAAFNNNPIIYIDPLGLKPRKPKKVSPKHKVKTEYGGKKYNLYFDVRDPQSFGIKRRGFIVGLFSRKKFLNFKSSFNPAKASSMLVSANTSASKPKDKYQPDEDFGGTSDRDELLKTRSGGNRAIDVLAHYIATSGEVSITIIGNHKIGDDPKDFYKTGPNALFYSDDVEKPLKADKLSEFCMDRAKFVHLAYFKSAKNIETHSAYNMTDVTVPSNIKLDDAGNDPMGITIYFNFNFKTKATYLKSAREL